MTLQTTSLVSDSDRSCVAAVTLSYKLSYGHRSAFREKVPEHIKNALKTTPSRCCLNIITHLYTRTHDVLYDTLTRSVLYTKADIHLLYYKIYYILLPQSSCFGAFFSATESKSHPSASFLTSISFHPLNYN